jgi:hypothetical protein
LFVPTRLADRDINKLIIIMKFISLILFAACGTTSVGSLVDEESKLREVMVEALEITNFDAVSEASVVYPQNLTFPAPKTYDGLGTDLGEPQQMDATYSTEIYNRIEDARAYVEREVRNNEKLSTVHHLCKNLHSSCAFWSVIGECENNPAVGTR